MALVMQQGYERSECLTHEAIQQRMTKTSEAEEGLPTLAMEMMTGFNVPYMQTEEKSIVKPL